MSTENHTDNIPDHVETGGGRSWRVSQGKIQRGQEGSTEERKALLGRLVSITERYGTTDDGRAYGKLAVTLECRDGRQTVTTPLIQPTTGKPTLSSCVSLAEALLDCAKGQLVQIEAAQGRTKNKFGSYSTYARVSHIDPVTFKPSPTARRDRAGGFDEEYLDSLMEELRQHPAWVAQEEAAKAPSALDKLTGLLAERGWAAPDDAWAAWKAQIAKGTGREHARPEDVPEEVWEAAFGQLSKASSRPAWLPEAEHDPFAADAPAQGAFA
jgi:hypothetical protein